VPTQPPINGLPMWAQLVITFAIGLATLAVAFKGYFVKEKGQSALTAAEPSSAAILAATIADGFAIRALSDSCVRLEAAVTTLTRCLEENIHHERNANDLKREICARLRELHEELENRKT
jgi:hypothetical protein